MALNAPKQPITIQIRPHPFQSPESSHLISALDADLSALYPDWDDLPHPGEDLGLKTEAWNPKPSRQAPDSSGTKTAPRSEADTPETGKREAKSIQESVKVGGEGLHFFVAFARPKTTGEGGDDDVNRRDKESPVGCVALRRLPYFPSHHPASAYDLSRREDVQARIDQEEKTGVVTAELKRMYVMSEYRSTKTVDPSVAVQLLECAESYAKGTMGVQRLVLETGVRQFAAIKLYERQGWKVGKYFGDYVSARTEVGGASLCYEKML